jgi:PII-like signaling protein
MYLTGSAQRLTVSVGDSDHYRHHSLATEIVHRAQAAGLAGCSVFRGSEGFGVLDELVSEGPVIVDDVTVHRYVGRSAETESTD